MATPENNSLTIRSILTGTTAATANFIDLSGMYEWRLMIDGLPTAGSITLSLEDPAQNPSASNWVLMIGDVLNGSALNNFTLWESRGVKYPTGYASFYVFSDVAQTLTLVGTRRY